MNIEKIMRMAEEAGITDDGMLPLKLYTFAKLIAAAEQEECAQLLDSLHMRVFGTANSTGGAVVSICSDVIRAKRNKE